MFIDVGYVHRRCNLEAVSMAWPCPRQRQLVEAPGPHAEQRAPGVQGILFNFVSVTEKSCMCQGI